MKYLVEDTTLTNVANSIRTKEGSTETIKVGDFASKIANLPTGENLDTELNAQDTLLENQNTAIADIYDALENKGETPYNALMDVSLAQLFQNTSYNVLKGTLVEIPKIDTTDFSNLYAMFSGCKGLKKAPELETKNVTNLMALFDNCINLESFSLTTTNNVTTMNGMFNSCKKLKKIPLMDTSNVTDMSAMFYECGELIEIEGELDMNKVTSVSNMFERCYKLETVKIKNLNCTSLNLRTATALSHDSLLYLLNNLVPTETSKRIYMGSDNLAKLSSEEQNIATSKGWSLVY